jgi:hypothetical protein
MQKESWNAKNVKEKGLLHVHRAEVTDRRDVHGVTDQEKRTVTIVMGEGLHLHMIMRWGVTEI